jgi:hypothetical protein
MLNSSLFESTNLFRIKAVYCFLGGKFLFVPFFHPVLLRTFEGNILYILNADGDCVFITLQFHSHIKKSRSNIELSHFYCCCHKVTVKQLLLAAEFFISFAGMSECLRQLVVRVSLR